MNDIISIISSVGFPIACCLAMFYYIKDTQDKLIDSINKLTIAIEKMDDKK